MKLWREAVYRRDGYACVLCGDATGGNLNADHIRSFSSILHGECIDSFQKALDCKILWDIENGRTLCHPCHTQTENYGNLGGKKEIHYFKNTYAH